MNSDFFPWKAVPLGIPSAWAYAGDVLGMDWTSGKGRPFNCSTLSFEITIASRQPRGPSSFNWMGISVKEDSKRTIRLPFESLFQPVLWSVCGV